MPQPSRSVRAVTKFSVMGLLRNWGEFVKFSHTLFALPFALASMILAARSQAATMSSPPTLLKHGWPGWKLFLLIVAAMATARTAAMAFNRIADHKIDALNPRTKDRHLPAGRISLLSASVLCGVSGAAFIGVCYFINPLCFMLAPAALAVILFYSLTKRFTDFTHMVLGLSLALAPVGAWIAVTGSFQFVNATTDTSGWHWFKEMLGHLSNGALLPTTMAVVVFFWLVGFDMIYAIQDYDFDRRHKLHSLVVRWGPHNALQAALLAHILMFGLLIFLGLLAGFRFPYWIGMLIIMILLGFEHWLVRRRGMQWAEKSFFRLNAVISMIFLTIVWAEVAFHTFWRSPLL